MPGYKPIKITGPETGLVTNRENFLIPNDAFPRLENAYVWRERIKRKQGYQLLARLRRVLQSAVTLSTQANGSSYSNADILADSAYGVRSTEPNAQIEPASVDITVGSHVFLDASGTGVLTSAGGSGTINYATGSLSLSFSPALTMPTNVQVKINYFPSLPVMGIRTRNQNAINSASPIIFDTKYAYRYSNGGYQEFIPGTTWTGADYEFFWSTNWWVSNANAPLFWVTNFSGASGDPIRYTDGSSWTNFSPQIDASGNLLTQALILLPFRGRLLALDTYEGSSLASSVAYVNRIRWSAIGNPLTTNAWRDDITGQGGFLDIPTSQLITSAGFVRDNLVIYCESSTWQLRYTGRSIAPFQIEKVNTELGSQSTFSGVEFDTSLVGIGDKGIVECDSFKSDRNDINIVDFVFTINQNNQGPQRVHGIRDFVKKLSYWTYPDALSNKFPNKRLVYNYENQSWAIFTDSLTCVGTFQPPSGRTWSSSKFSWRKANFTWRNRPSLIPQIIGGNQQGYILYLDQQTTNDVSLSIQAISGNVTTPTVISVSSHNLQSGQVIRISGIPTGTGYSGLNGGIFGVEVTGSNTLALWKYDPSSGDFDLPQLDASSTYIGGGQIAVREGFSIQSKAFNFMDDGQNIQIGWIDALFDTTAQGACTLNIYQNFDSSNPTNAYPENENESLGSADPFFNAVVPTSAPSGSVKNSNKTWQRVFCPTRANFLTSEWTLSNAQLVGVEQESDVQLHAQVVWARPAGRMTSL